MKKENVIKEKNLAVFKRKHVVFFDQSKMKATFKENSFNKYKETTMELYVNQEMEIWVSKSNGTDHFSLVRPEYSGPALKEVHIDQSGHFGRLDHLTKLLSPVLLFCILLTRTIIKCVMA